MSQIQAIVPVLMIPKEMNVQVAYNLHHFEIACKCTNEDCTYTLISQDALCGWTAMRKSVNKPLRINSGYRCQKWNSSPGIKGVDTSRHKSGHALDIATTALDIKEKEEVIRVARLFFDVVIVYDNFIHCHNEPDKQNEISIGRRMSDCP